MTGVGGGGTRRGQVQGLCVHSGGWAEGQAVSVCPSFVEPAAHPAQTLLSHPLQGQGQQGPCSSGLSEAPGPQRPSQRGTGPPM